MSGRTYPVEIRYRPLEVAVTTSADDDPDDPDREIVRTEMRDEIEAIIDAIGELTAEPPGDILVFCPVSAKSAIPPTHCKDCVQAATP